MASNYIPMPPGLLRGRTFVLKGKEFIIGESRRSILKVPGYFHVDGARIYFQGLRNCKTRIINPVNIFEYRKNLGIIFLERCNGNMKADIPLPLPRGIEKLAVQMNRLGETRYSSIEGTNYSFEKSALILMGDPFKASKRPYADSMVFVMARADNLIYQGFLIFARKEELSVFNNGLKFENR